MTYRVRSFKLVFKDGTDKISDRAVMKGIQHEEERPARKNPVHTMVARVKRVIKRFVKPPRKALRNPSEQSEPSPSLAQLTGFTESLARVDDFVIAMDGLQSMSPSAMYARLVPPFAQLNPILRPFLSSIWSNGFGANLRRLTISIPMDSWQLVFSPSFQIDHLEALGVLFSKPRNRNLFLLTQFEECIATYLIPFIQRHVNTLRALDIISPSFDCAPFFQRIGHILSLHTIKLEECGGLVATRNENNFYHFLQQHHETITHITWKFSNSDHLDYDVLGRDIWFDLRYHELIPLPHLKVLELKNLAGFSDLPTPFLSNMERLLRSHNSTLTKLCLEGYNPYLDTFYDLLNTISSSVLEHFEIGTRALTRNLLSTMATKLPSLCFLRLSYNDVGRQTVVRVIQLASASIISYPILDFLMSTEDRRELGPECPLHKLYKYHFLQDMESFRLPSWSLEELHLETVNKSRLDWEADASEINKAILRSLPNVMAFNGKHRDRALS
jgi:hypothetical protein